MTNRNALEIEKSYEGLIGRFCKWAEGRSDIRIAIVIGSRARRDHPADEWADLDIVIVTAEPDHYVSTSDWINNFGKPLLTFVEPTSTGDEKERRVLYEKMLDVDFAIIPQGKAQQLIQSVGESVGATVDSQALAQISNLLGRGVRVLIDKDGVMSKFGAFAASFKKPPAPVLRQDEFLDLVSNFLYHAVFTAKHLRRGELWWTTACLDCHMQHLLLRLIEWHALASHDWKHDVWFRGRFLEEWAHSETVKGLRETFAHYEEADIKRALLATIDLFRSLATETATKLNYPYPVEADKNVTEWIRACISDAEQTP
jgi:aminoglycoside 6-adenylyltransferase